MAQSQPVSEKTCLRRKANHTTGKTSKVTQKILLSTGLMMASFSRLSKIQTFEPSSLMSFHHLKPTRRRPLTFLVTQKSSAKKTQQTMKVITKGFDLNTKRPNRYVARALVLFETHRIHTQHFEEYVEC